MPREPPPAFHEGMSLEWPLVALEPFLFVGRAALDRLCERLESRGFACQRLELEMRLEPDGFQTRSVELPAPTPRRQDPAHPGAPGARGPAAGRAGGRLHLRRPSRPPARGAALDLRSGGAVPDKLATTLARLFALLGPDRVGSPRPVDGHRPERFALVDFSPPPPPEVRREPRAGRGLLAVRVLRPPVEIEVLTRRERSRRAPPARGEDAARLPPVEIRSLPGDEAAKRPAVEGTVRVASGPWGLEEELVGRRSGGAGLLGRGDRRPRALSDLPGARDRRLVRRRDLRLARRSRLRETAPARSGARRRRCRA